MHQFGGPGNGNFVQGDMNTFGVVYMSTVGHGLIVGAPEGTEFITRMRDARNVAGVLKDAIGAMKEGWAEAMAEAEAEEAKEDSPDPE